MKKIVRRSTQLAELRRFTPLLSRGYFLGGGKKDFFFIFDQICRFFGQGQIKMMTRTDLVLNAQRREWRRLKAEVVSLFGIHKYQAFSDNGIRSIHCNSVDVYLLLSQ